MYTTSMVNSILQAQSFLNFSCGCTLLHHNNMTIDNKLLQVIGYIHCGLYYCSQWIDLLDNNDISLQTYRQRTTIFSKTSDYIIITIKSIMQSVLIVTDNKSRSDRKQQQTKKNDENIIAIVSRQHGKRRYTLCDIGGF